MQRLSLLLILTAACLLGGCTVVSVVPTINGTVVDGVTGDPIPSAVVEIEYCDGTRTDRTDSAGQYAFPPRNRAYLRFINAHVDRDSWFTLNVKVDGYQPLSTPRSSAHFPTHGMSWTGKIFQIDPLRLSPNSADSP